MIFKFSETDERKARRRLGAGALFGLPKPRQGRQIIAQDKAAEAAVLGKPLPPSISLFSKLGWPGQPNFEKRDVFIVAL